MEDYQSLRKKKLSQYKIKNLTTEQGKWKNYFYDHILPVDQQEKNIIESIRNEFWTYRESQKIKLNQYFHHLNSSQALCFNLFFPLFNYDKKFLSFVMEEIFKIQNGNIEKCEFEKILDPKEFTNFDFFIQHSNFKKTLFEIKYTERKFANTNGGKGHIKKYQMIYKPKLEKIINPTFLNEDFVFKNYQVIRNLSYIDKNTIIVFIFPKENQDLQSIEGLISKILLPEYSNNIRVVYLENLISQILKNDFFSQIHPVFNNFKALYLD